MKTDPKTISYAQPVNVPAQKIRDAVSHAGFSLCGIAPYRPMPEQLERVEKWLAAGRHGSMNYMERNVSKRADAKELFPETSTVIVCAVNYRNGAWDTPDDGRPKVASYAFAKDYHDSIKSMLRQVLSSLQGEYPGLHGRALSDSAPLLEKAWAVEAGLGWIGRNSLLITPQYGSSILLGELLVNAAVDEYDIPFERDGCGKCRRCMDNCPNGAVGEDMTLDASKCISRLTIEPGADLLSNISGNGSGPLSGWVFGCDDCQKCCPHNIHKPVLENPLFDPVIDPALFDREFCRGMNFEQFESLFAGTPLERPGLEKIYRRIKAITGTMD